MEVKPVPKPRSMVADRPVPAPRTIPPSVEPDRSRSTSESSQSERSDESRSTSGESRMNAEFFRSLSSSSRQLKDEISEKMTVKGRAVISSTRNASIRLEKSVKNLLTRRLTSIHQEQDTRKVKDPVEDDRCVSMPGNDIFSSISFYSPLNSNLKSMRNEEDLSESKNSPPPPVYPPPPLPDESIYDELQSVASGSSGRYDTLSSVVSDKIGLDDSLDLARTLKIQDMEFSEGKELEGTDSERLSRSDSWTFYDAGSRRTSSNLSEASVQNSLYENWRPRKVGEEKVSEDDVTRQKSTKSLLFEFDPFARTSEDSLYSNYENNDLMLLEALLATSDTPSSAGSIVDPLEVEERDEQEVLEEEAVVVENREDQEGREDLEEDDEEQEGEIDNVTMEGKSPPEPPKRFDSLPKNEYDQVEFVEEPDKQTPAKNPALPPKLVHLAMKKQPAVPPRKISSAQSKPLVPPKKTFKDNVIQSTSSPSAERKSTEQRSKVSVMQKLRKLSHDSTAHVIRPNVISFVKSGSKLLSRNKENPAKVKTSKMQMPKVSLNHKPTTHKGVVYKTGVGIERAKDLVQRMTVLLDRKLSFYVDKNMSTLKEAVNLDSIHSIHLLQDVRMVEGDTVHCLAISGEGRPSVHVLYAKGITERRIWAQRILEALTPIFPTKYTAEFTRVGWAYLKEGVTGCWFPAWLLLQQRILVYTKTLEPIVLEQIDLRKARCIVLREQEGPIDSRSTSVTVPVVVVDAGGSGALHIAAPGQREGPAWAHALHQAATYCGPSLDQQQLTQDNVPVILEKCINFIYAHGIMSEGIYRRSGSSTAAVRLLEAFRRDAWATQITRGSYSEHDVATVLRRFLRDLPEPLIPCTIHDQLNYRTSSKSNEEERATVYARLLSTLNPVSAASLRKILAHLHCLSQQSSRNLMTVENLSAFWGPTLMHVGETSAEEWNGTTNIVADLIRLYPKLYQLSPADLAKEARILQVLERHHGSNNGLRGAPSGDLKIWIYILSKDGQCVNVTDLKKPLLMFAKNWRTRVTFLLMNCAWKNTHFPVLWNVHCITANEFSKPWQNGAIGIPMTERTTF
ncbi:uncharacterized protein RhoGAP15B isoform X2 [Prorops nasuta]|uniref:uncharacterized protein RhoGAP15B isoform X2 n=1 Tax=Prorops nasuta TaxID=863751 RepID=UPI0034CF1956